MLVHAFPFITESGELQISAIRDLGGRYQPKKDHGNFIIIVGSIKGSTHTARFRCPETCERETFLIRLIRRATLINQISSQIFNYIEKSNSQTNDSSHSVRLNPSLHIITA